MKNPAGKNIEHYIWGRIPILEAIRSGREIDRILISFNTRGNSVTEIKKAAGKAGIPVKTISNEKFRKLPLKDKNHQGIAAVINDFKYSSKDILFNHPDFWEQRWIILDGITDPHNLGAIIRTAEGGGFSGIIIPERNSAQINDTVVKTSAGAVFHIPVIRTANFVSFLKEMKESGVALIGTMPDSRTSCYEIDYKPPFAIIIGSEGKGISQAVKKLTDKNVYIPLLGEISSLNASVSAAVLIYESVRRLQQNFS